MDTIKVAPVTALTCTGDRPFQFDICLKIMNRMNPRPAQWLIVDDGKVPISDWQIPDWAEYIRREPLADDLPMTLSRNIIHGVKFVSYDTLLFIEDDDYYPANYFQRMLEKSGSRSACGSHVRRFLHLSSCGYCIRPDSIVLTASLLLRGNAIKMFTNICHEIPSGHKLDITFWRRYAGNKWSFDDIKASSIGIKGWGCVGRDGFSKIHRVDSVYAKDTGMLKFKEWIGENELQWYKPFIKDVAQ